MDAKMIRARARENLSGSWGLAIAVAAVACLLGGLMAGSFSPRQNQAYLLTALDRCRISISTGSIFAQAITTMSVLWDLSSVV